MSKKKPTTPTTRGGARAGAGRKPVYQELGRPISVRLERSVQDALDAKCAALGIPRTKGLQEAVARWVKPAKR